MEAEMKCVWCGEAIIPEVRVINNGHGNLKERRCPKCKAIVAVYLEEKRHVL